MFYNKSDQSYNILISDSCTCLLMSELIWKCFRCNLTFKDTELARMHKEISSHSITKIKAIAV